jgi:hypothetical protein
VDPRIGVNDLEKENSLPYRDPNSYLSVLDSVASPYSDSATAAHVLLTGLSDFTWVITEDSTCGKNSSEMSSFSKSRRT